MSAHVVIIGAGYAGVMAAKRLHQMIAAGYDATVSFDRALPRAAHRVFGEVTTIEAALGRLTLDDGSVLDYDYLVYAVGSRQLPSTIAGADEHGFGVAEFEDAVRLSSRLATLDEKAAVCVVGGGLTGIETAAELAEQRSSRITLVTGGILAPDLSERARSAILRTLTDLGVDIVTESRVTRIDGSSCELAGGVRVEADCTILATEFGVPELARRSGLPVDDLGRLKVDDRLECSSHPNIFGAGDGVAVGDLSLRMSVDDRMGCHSTPLSLLQLDMSRSWSRSIADSVDDRRSLADVRLTDDVFVTRVDVVEIEGACGDE